MPPTSTSNTNKDSAKRPAPELLLPAGSPEKLRYAMAYGADAVYLGLPMASLRTPSRGQQFTPDNLGEHIKYVQERGGKAYVTINIFAANHDIKRVIPHLEQLEGLKPDAIILSDPGIFRLARKHAPSVPVHLSTQANTLNLEACAFWQDLGVERVILAREVPMREMAEIHSALPDLELECFVHGSLCVAYSGRCVISDYLTDNTKNSNKGMCGNSCRWEFENAEASESLPSIQMKEASRPEEAYTFEEDQHGSYMLNSKDLCLVEHLPALQKAGIVSFKAEGRTKSLYYVSTVGQVYREAIDYYQEHGAASDEQITEWARRLSQAGNRGFTEGFLSGRPNDSAYNYQTSDSQQGSAFTATVSNFDNPDYKDNRILVTSRNPFSVGEKLTWMTPSGVLDFELKHLENKHGESVSALHTNQSAYIEIPDGVHRDELGWTILSRQEKSSVVV